jgi:hypothetical protein
MSALFPNLPLELENKVMSFRIDQMVLNITTGEYIHNFKNPQLKPLFKKLSKHDALCKEDVGESRWKKADKIIIVPIHLEKYVKETYQNILVKLEH